MLARFVLPLFFLGAMLSLQAQGLYDVKLAVQVTEVPAPFTKSPTRNPCLFRTPEGVVFLVWIEASTPEKMALRISEFDTNKRAWTAPQTVIDTELLAAQPVDARPSLAAKPGGKLALSWTGLRLASPVPIGDNTLAYVSYSNDAGRTWTLPSSLSAASTPAAFPVLAPGEADTWHAVWLDQGIDPSPAQDPLQARPLVYRLLGVKEFTQRHLDRVSTALASFGLASFPDGSTLLVNREGALSEPRDPRSLRTAADAENISQRIGRETWTIPFAPGFGIRLATRGPSCAAVWYSAADKEPRILTSTTPDAGQRWTIAQRVDLGHAVGPAETVLLSDGSQLVLWQEGAGEDPSQPAGYWLRRYAANGASAMPAMVLGSTQEAPLGHPSLVVLKDSTTSASEVLLAVVTAMPGAVHRLRTFALKLPEAEELALLDSGCKCGPGEVPGHGIKARIVAVDLEKGTLQLQHEAIPGLLRKGELVVRAGPVTLSAAGPGRELIGRITWLNEQWELTEARLFAAQ